MLITLTDQVLGEIPNMRYIDSFDVLEEPREGPSFPLSQLPEQLKCKGIDLAITVEDYLGSYTGYQMEPDQDPDADWRLDVIAGSTCCATLINGYLGADDDAMDRLHADGVVGGFFIYPLDTLREETGSQKIFNFRDRLETFLDETCGPEELTITGGATGLYCGYVDFIAWDLEAVLSQAKAFFDASELPWASFHVFRRDVGGVRLKSPDDASDEDAPSVDSETGSLLSAADIATLKSYEGEVSSYFGRMYTFLTDFIDSGVKAGRFTENQAREDLTIALWYSYACNNLDEYLFYYRAAQWMPFSEKNAKGCGAWYYRYACALLYCGRLEEARAYSEQGVREEPSYPWGWLLLGKLRAHFGERDSALEAVDRGLALVPGDYEFLTLKKEIEAGATIEQMEYHWIDPSSDRQLQIGLAEEADAKQQVISCITVDQEGLERFFRMFQPDPESYMRDAPNCSFSYPVQEHTVDLIFEMNEAGLSKLREDWLLQLKNWLDSGCWLTADPEDAGVLQAVLVRLDYHIHLFYPQQGGERLFHVELLPDGTPAKRSEKVSVLLYDPANAEAFYAQIEHWNEADEYTRCIDALEAIPKEQWDYRLVYALARALENYAVIGDHGEGTPAHRGDRALRRAIELLESVREEGQDRAEWNMRMAYGYQYLTAQEEKAIPYAERWAELAPEDEDAHAVIRECQKEIEKRRQGVRRRRRPGPVTGSTPFAGFDFDGFWDDSEYALREYVGDPPSDALIASVEQELGYKLPAAYIWLMKRHNGGIPVNDCYPTDEPTSWAEDHVAITGIFGIGREKSCSLCGELGSQFMIDEWGYPAIGVAICDCPSAGHDMIFLDYRACGPQGEPAVVHVDQENGYKITHLADSFEEFIRGLEPESAFDEDAGEETDTDHTGVFTGFVLLSKGEWDKEQFIRDMQEKWDIPVDEYDASEEKADDALVFEVGDMLAAVSLAEYPIPGGEAEANAENNYMWEDAVKTAKAHRAHLMVAVLGKEENLMEKGRLFTKVVAACCRQKNAAGIYTSGVVFEPRFYEGFADMIKNGELPIFNWIWFGLWRDEHGMNGYTYGMASFGKDEMEVLGTDAKPSDLRDFLASLASYVLENDVELHDGETIGFAEDDKHTITRSPGIGLPEEQMTLKISWASSDGDPDDDDDDPDGEASEDEEAGVPEVYTEEEMEAIEGHIQQYFGDFENVFHELASPDIHVDICVVQPSAERDYYTLVTMGMGAHRMNVPEELAEYKLERAELAIALPGNWKLKREDLKNEQWYWPIRLLKALARLPIASDTWLGFGHTMDNEKDFAKDTKLCAAILTGPQDTEDGSEVCILPSGEEVNFYQVIPLYRDELEYKLAHDADALLDKMNGISFVVEPDRQDAITRGTLSNDNFDGEMDDASYHIESIEEKGLPIDPINAYNHMAIYLRWCMEHDLMGDEFLEEYGDVVQKVKADPASVDLRAFIRDELDGQLVGSMFNKIGRAFAAYYYGAYSNGQESPFFPSDIDNYAIGVIGQERNYSDEIQDEAYLFIPFDEDYYQAMAKVIEERFTNWQGQDFDEDTLEPSELAEALMEYLDCECTYFPSMKDDDPIMSAYSYAKRESVKEGFVPVLIKADDETLWECLIMNSDPDSDGEDDYAFDPDKVADYRKKMLSAPVKDGKTVLGELIGQRKEEAEEDDLDWEEEILGELEGGDENDRISSYWDDDTEMTYPLILAKIPVKNPWEIFAYLPFGNWNDCPDTPDLMAVTKYWFEQYGTVPAAMSHDELEFLLPAPVPKDKAMEVAVELYGFCPDVIDQGPEDATVGALADVLRQSTVWYFWWD